MEKYKEALEDMVFQFGYRTVVKDQPAIWAGGLSALEGAFDALGWKDPHVITEEGNCCEIKGCWGEIVAGTPWGKEYLHLCSEHSSMLGVVSNIRFQPHF